jgi:diacylglycerol kinase (ATP)
VGFRLVLDGRPLAARGFSVVIANSGYYGAGMHIVPHAEVDDGRLDVLVIGGADGRVPSRWSLIASMREVYAGTHLHRPDVQVHRAEVVELAMDRPVPVYGDGEPLGAAPVRVAVRPAALRVLVPG